MSSWSKELKTLLGIVLVGFSAATVATLIDKTPIAQRQALLEADLRQEPPLPVPAMLAGYNTALEMRLIDSEQVLRLIEIPTTANVQELQFSSAHLQSTKFSFERQLTFGTYNLK